MKRIALAFAFLLSIPSFAAEDWKGTADTSSLDVGALAGLSNVQGAHGFGLLGTVAKRIGPEGFLDDVNDVVSIELALGPHFRAAANCGVYALQLRWDFQKDDQWLIYAAGGLHGNFSASAYLHSFDIYPRFAAGAMFSPQKESVIRFRAEVSHEMIGVGFNIPLWF